MATLLAKKAIDDITVREIVELCEIRRQTFYYHFADIYALMDWTLELNYMESRAGSECGKMVVGIRRINGKEYSFDVNGACQTL